MKSLLKKGEKSDKGAAPKKSLFGKKPAKKVADDIDEPVAPKKTGFSLTKKRAAGDAAAAEQGNNKKAKPTKPAKKPAKGGGMDVKKLIPILGGLLALVLLALAAKMFLFSEPEPEPVVPKITPPAAQPAPPAPAQPVAPPPVETAPAQPVAPVAETTQPQPAQPVAPAAPTGSVAAPAPVQAAPGQQNFTREDFLRESKNKVYRERETTQTSQ